MTTSPRRIDGRFLGESVAGLGAVLAGGAVLVGLLVLAAGPVLAFDRLVADGLNAAVAPRPGVVATLEVLTAPGSTVAGAAVLTTLALALLVRRERGQALFVVVTGLGALALGTALKELVGRLRPIVDVPVATAPGPSFPSGHTLTATVWVGAVLLVLLPAVPARARRAVVGAGIVLVVVVGFTRIALGVHYVSDVVAGWLIGLAWLAVTTHAFRAWRRREDLPVAPLHEGLAPEAADELRPAPDHATRPADVGTTAARLAAAAVLLLGAVIGLGHLLPGLDPAADLDGARWFTTSQPPELAGPSAVASELGGTGTMIAVGAAACVLVLAVLRHWRPVVAITVALVGEVLIFLTGSAVVDRPRPPVSHLDAELPPTSSFPSGHVAASICAYGVIAAVVFCATRRWWRWVVAGTAAVLVVAVALARLYRGAHYPTDVLGSVLFAVPWLLLTLRLVGVRAPRRSGGDPAPTRRG
jgi:undecaprenyl-diphosphatase